MTQLTSNIYNSEIFSAHWEWTAPDGDVYIESFIYPDADGQLDEHLRKYIAPDFERDFCDDRTEWAFDSACGYMSQITPGGEDVLTPPPVYSLNPSPKPRLNVLFFPTMASQFAHIMAIFDNDNIQVGDKVTLKTNATIIHDASFFLGVSNRTDVDLFVVSKRPVDGSDILRWNLPSGCSVCVLVDWRYFLRGAVYKYEPFSQIPGDGSLAPSASEPVAVRLKYDPLQFLDRMPPYMHERVSSKYVFLRLFWGLFKTNLFTYDDFDTALTQSALFERGTPSGLNETDYQRYLRGTYPYSVDVQETILKTGQLPLDSVEYLNSQLDPRVFREGAPLLLLLDAALAVCGQRLYHGNGYVYEVFQSASGSDPRANGTTESVSPRFPPLVCFYPDFNKHLDELARRIKNAFKTLRDAFAHAQNITDSQEGLAWLNELKDAMRAFDGETWVYCLEMEDAAPEDVLAQIADLSYQETIEWVSTLLVTVMSKVASDNKEHKKDLENLRVTLTEWANCNSPESTPQQIFAKLEEYVKTILNAADFYDLANEATDYYNESKGVMYDAEPRAVRRLFPDNYFAPTYWTYIQTAPYYRKTQSGSYGAVYAPLDDYPFNGPTQFIDNPNFRESITVLTSVWLLSKGAQDDQRSILHISCEDEAGCRETARRIAKRVETLMLSPESKTFFFGSQANNDLIFSDQQENREYYDKVSTFARLDVNPLCLPIGSPRSGGGGGRYNSSSSGNVEIKTIWPFVENFVEKEGKKKTYVLDSHTPIKLDAETYQRSISLPLNWVEARWLTCFTNLDCWSAYEDDEYGLYTVEDKDNAFIEHAACTLNAFDFSILVKEYDPEEGFNADNPPISPDSKYNMYEFTQASQTICWRGLLINGTPSTVDSEYDERIDGEMDVLLYGAEHKGEGTLPGAKQYYTIPWMYWSTGEKGENRFTSTGVDGPGGGTVYERYDQADVLRVRISPTDGNGDKYELFDHRGVLAMVVYPEAPNGAYYEVYDEKGELKGARQGLPPGMYKPAAETENDVAEKCRVGSFTKYVKLGAWFTVDSIATPYPSVDGYAINWRGMRIDGTKPYYRYSMGGSGYADPITYGQLPIPDSEYEKTLTVEQQTKTTENGLVQFVHLQKWLTLEVHDSSDYSGKEYNIDWRGMRIDGISAEVTATNSNLSEPIKEEEENNSAGDDGGEILPEWGGSEGNSSSNGSTSEINAAFSETGGDDGSSGNESSDGESSGGESSSGSGSSTELLKDAAYDSKLVQFMRFSPWLSVDAQKSKECPGKDYKVDWRGLFIKGTEKSSDSSSGSSSESSGEGTSSSSSSYGLTQSEAGESSGSDGGETSAGSGTGEVGGYAKIMRFKSPIHVERKESEDWPGQDYEISVDLDDLNYTIDTVKESFLQDMGTAMTQSFLTGLGTPETVKALSPNTMGFGGLSVPNVSVSSNQKLIKNVTLDDTAEHYSHMEAHYDNIGQVVTGIEGSSSVSVIDGIKVRDTYAGTSDDDYELLSQFIQAVNPDDEYFCKGASLDDSADSDSVGAVVVGVDAGEPTSFITNVSLSETNSTGDNKISIGKVLTSACLDGSETVVKSLSLGTTAASGAGKASYGQVLTGASASGMTSFVKTMTLGQGADTGTNKISIGPIVVAASEGGSDSFVKEVGLSSTYPSDNSTKSIGQVVVDVTTQEVDVLVVPENPQQNGVKSISAPTGTFLTGVTPTTWTASTGTAVGTVYVDANDSTATEDFIYGLVTTGTKYQQTNVVHDLSLLSNASVVTDATLVSETTSSNGGIQVVTAIRCNSSGEIEYDTAYIRLQLTTTPLSSLIQFETATLLKDVGSVSRAGICKIATTPVTVLLGDNSSSKTLVTGITSSSGNAVSSVTATNGYFVECPPSSPSGSSSSPSGSSGSPSGSSGSPSPNTAKAIASVTATKNYLTKQTDDAVTSVSMTNGYINGTTGNAATSVSQTKRYLNANTGTAPTAVDVTESYLIADTAKAITNVSAETKYLNLSEGRALTSIGETAKHLAKHAANVATGGTPVYKYLNAEKADVSKLITVTELGTAVDFNQVSQVDVVKKLDANPPSANGVVGYTQQKTGEAVVEVTLKKDEDEEEQGEDGGDNANA